MNLVAYDNVNNITNRKRSWIDVYHKILYSREINYRKFVCFGKKYDTEIKIILFYIIMLDDEPSDRASFKTVLTSNGCIKINIKGIWEESGLIAIKSKYLNVFLKHIEHSDDGDIYEFCLAL